MSSTLSFDENGLPMRGEPWDGRAPKLERRFEPQADGRRARGELEYLADVACKRWLAALGSVTDPDPQHLLATDIAEAIERLDGREAKASSVTGVLRRWQQIGYAMVESKPVRFVGITADGTRFGVDEMHRRYRRRNHAAHYQW